MKSRGQHKYSLLAMLTIMIATSLPSAAFAAGLMAIQGTVRDPLGRPLPGVSVTDNRGRTVTTAGDGTYRIEETTPNIYRVTAYRDGLVTQSKLVGPADAIVPVDFTLSYIVQGTVSPTFFRNDPPVTLTIQATSYAPSAGQCLDFIDATSGSTVPLSLGSTGPGASSSWTGSFEIGAGRGDGSHQWRLAARDCASGTNLSDGYAAHFVVDSVGPAVLPLFPLPDHNTLLRQPPISVLLTDDLSGIDSASPRLKIDGLEVPASFDSWSRKLTYTPSAPLSLGVHTLTASALDAAGNPSSFEWNINIASFEPKAGTSSIPATTVSYATAANTVSFPSVKALVSESEFTLSSSISTGLGSAIVKVPLDAGSVLVTFHSEGIPDAQTILDLGSRSFAQDFAVLAPSDDPIDVRIAGRRVDVGAITVPVPMTHQLGGTATLIKIHTPVGISVGYPDPTPNKPDCADSTRCEVIGVVECYLESNQGATGCDGTYTEVFLNVAGVRRAVVGGNGNLINTPPSTTGQKLPLTACAIQEVTCEDLLATARWGWHRTYWALGNRTAPLFSAYGNHWYYQVRRNSTPGPDPFMAVWQGSDVNPGSAACVTGSQKLIQTRVKEAAHFTESTRGWSASGDKVSTVGKSGDKFDPSSYNVELTRSETIGSAAVETFKVSQTADLSSVVNGSLALQGKFEYLAGKTYDLDAAVVDRTGTAALHRWTPDSWSEIGEKGAVEFMSGTGFRQASGNNLATNYAYTVGTYFRFGYNSSQC